MVPREPAAVVSASLCLLLFLYPHPCTTECQSGWHKYGGYCFYLSEGNDTRSTQDVVQECYIMDAQLARPESAEELDFLKTLTSSSNHYGWLINIVYPRGQQDFEYYDIVQNTYKTFVPEEGSVPDLLPEYDPTRDYTGWCIALHNTDFWSTGWFPAWFEPVPCDTLLHVACRAEQSEIPEQNIDSISWFKEGEAIFWISGQLANFDDAKKTCDEKGMKLVDNIDGRADDFLKAIDTPGDAVPFWSAATFGLNGPEWTNGVAVKDSEIQWGDLSSSSGPFMVLLNSGYAHLYNAFSRWNSHQFFPYICKKIEVKGGQFDCPNLWRRAGRSCYSAAFVGTMAWKDASESCKKQGSHLLKIDSPDEVLWLNMIFASEIFKDFGYKAYDEVWTGSSDLYSEGNFTWEDGSTIDTALFPWMTGPNESLETLRCSRVWPSVRQFYPTSCTKEYNAACQYKLEHVELSCAANWKQFNRTCYFMESSYNYVIYEMNIPMCMLELTGSSVQRYRVTALQIQSEEVLDFLIDNFQPGYDYWLGLEATEKLGEFKWLDGTIEDIYRTHTNDDEETDEPKHCVAAGVGFNAIKKSCDTKMIFSCEKELSESSPIGSGFHRVTSLDIYFSLSLSLIFFMLYI